MFKNKYTVILIVIIAVGFALRIIGFNFEYLFDSVSDENYANSCALRMINNRTLLPNNCGSSYPALFTLINLPNIAIGLFVLLLQNNFNTEVVKQFLALYPFTPSLLIVRLFSVIIGTATIFLIYKITKLLFSSQLKGVIAAAFLAVSLIPVQMSHWGKAWTLVLFFSFLALYSALRIYQTGSRKHYILSAVFISSSFGVHYVGFFSVIFIFLGNFFRKFRNVSFSFGGAIRDNKNLYLGLALTLFLSFLWLFLNKQGIYNMLFDSNVGLPGYYQGRGGGISQYFYSAFLYFKDFAIFDPVLFLLLTAALIFSFRKFFTFKYLFLVSFFIFYFGGMVLINLDYQIRWVLPLIAISIPVAADSLGDLRSKFKSKVAYIGLIIALLFPSLSLSAIWDYILILPNTRFAAKSWAQENIPQNSKILFLDVNLILAVSREGAKDLNSALAEVRPPNPRYLYLAENGQNVLPGYRVVSWGQFLDNPEYFEWNQFDYYILSYLNESEYQREITLMPAPEKLELIHQIRPFNLSGRHKSFIDGLDTPLEYFKILKNIRMTGPSIEIYRKI